MLRYIAIDLKSFYASVECVDRGFDPLGVNLVVADKSRTDKTICLAVSPSLKAYGISGRARLFEVVARVAEINAMRRGLNSGRLEGKSYIDSELRSNPLLAVDYVVASPRMARYIDVSSKVYSVYLKYIAPEDIHVYSVDEVFIDALPYLRTYKMTARELACVMIKDVLKTTGVTATAGIGENLYLSKIAMDIVAKKSPPDEDGVRIAELDERSYREKLWGHKPITDFWRIGAGYRNTLSRCGMFTMGDVARCSLCNQKLLYKLFGVNAELLIDHAWGRETATIADIKAYRPKSKSLSSGQVLPRPYEFDEARLIIKEMTELLALDLVDKGLVCDQVTLTVGYDIDNFKLGKSYDGEITRDHYGRCVPKQAHGSENLGSFTSSTKAIIGAVVRLFDRIVNQNLLVRRMYIAATHLKPSSACTQLSLFEPEEPEDEKVIQQTILSLHKRFGKNSVLRGISLEDCATQTERNRQIGGHRA